MAAAISSNRAVLIGYINSSDIPGMLKPAAILMVSKIPDDSINLYVGYLQRIKGALDAKDREALRGVAIEIADRVFDGNQAG